MTSRWLQETDPAQIHSRLRPSLAGSGLAALVVLLLGVGGAGLINRRLRRQTHGMGEREITRMYEYYRAVLHAVREGLLLLDSEGRVQLVNDEARRLLSLPEHALPDASPAELAAIRGGTALRLFPTLR